MSYSCRPGKAREPFVERQVRTASQCSHAQRNLSYLYSHAYGRHYGEMLLNFLNSKNIAWIIKVKPSPKTFGRPRKTILKLQKYKNYLGPPLKMQTPIPHSPPPQFHSNRLKEEEAQESAFRQTHQVVRWRRPHPPQLLSFSELASL